VIHDVSQLSWGAFPDSILSRALEWLEIHAAGTVPVFLPGEIPDDVLQALRRLDLVVPVPGGLSVVRSPGADPVEVLRALV